MIRLKKPLAQVIKEALEDAKSDERIIRDDEDLSHFLAGWIRGAVQSKIISDWKVGK